MPLPEEQRLSKLVRNERTKLLATGLNNLGIATIVAGSIGPLIARSYGASTVNGVLLPGLLAFIYLVGGISLMSFGRVVLSELIE
ncbi:MAG: hypothetical protein M3N26_06335 [Pseudomonadota bacterium]|nr:hypothetical protein [Pseudomonadota bacterium]